MIKENLEKKGGDMILTKIEFAVMKQLMGNGFSPKKIVGIYSSKSGLYRTLENMRGKGILKRFEPGIYEITDTGYDSIKETMKFYSLEA